jgi:hypothetical protein
MSKKQELFCKLCNYTTTMQSYWLKHIESQKHLRDGLKKSTKCDLCEYESNTHWNVKAHKLQLHASPEERQKCKYYCGICDYVFFCESYLSKHVSGKIHLNKVKIKESLEQIDKKYNELQIQDMI